MVCGQHMCFYMPRQELWLLLAMAVHCCPAYMLIVTVLLGAFRQG